MRAASVPSGVPSGVTVGVAGKGSESSRDETLLSGEVKSEPNSSSGGTDGWLSMEALGMCRGIAEEMVELGECVRSAASLSTLGEEVDASSSEAVVSPSDFVPLPLPILPLPLTTITSCVLDAS